MDKNGILDMEQLVASLTPDTAVVSLMWANNETGVIFPVEKAAELAHERGILFHTDAVQAAGKIPIDMRKNAIDMLSISGHKLHAPKGIGVLYVRKGTKFSPFLIGGHQEKGRRGGTENTPSIIGLGKACELAAAQHGGGKHRRSRACATSWRRPSWPASRKAGSTGIPRSACPTRRTSASSSSKARGSSCS